MPSHPPARTLPAMAATRLLAWPRLLPALALIVLAAAEEVAAPAEAAAPGGAEAEADEGSGAESLLKELTIGMGSEVLDERTVVMRDSGKSAKPGRKLFHLRLGNVAPIERGDLSEEKYAAKREAAKKALAKYAEKTMVFWKAAPESAQPKEQGEVEVVVADLWTFEGHHINGALKKAGHLAKTPEYESELARDILRAEAEVQKQESYKKLEEALRENEKAKREEAKAAKKAAKEAAKEAEEAKKRSLGTAGWVGLGVALLLPLGALLNFGRPAKKQKVNLNKKRGFFQQFMAKVKGG